MLSKIVTATIAASAMAAGLAVPALADGTASGGWQTLKLPGAGAWSAVDDISSAGGAQWAVVTGIGTGSGSVWENSGSGWSRASVPLPAGYGEPDIHAGSATDVWAFGLDYKSMDYSGGFDALHWNGSTWAAAGMFDHPNVVGAGNVNSALVFNPANVWAFTNGLGNLNALDGSAWHWNGTAWSRVNAPGPGLSCASALSPASIWACDGGSVAHWNGRSWTAMPVTSLLPSDEDFQQVNAVVAESPDNVYAVGDANGPNFSGPLVVLHWNGRIWAKVAAYADGDVSAAGAVSDGQGGLWLALTSAPGTLLHWTGAQLTKVSLPVPASTVTLDSIARTAAGAILAGGYLHPAGLPEGEGTPVLFTYTP
jgi:hypothetical protein